MSVLKLDWFLSEFCLLKTQQNTADKFDSQSYLNLQNFKICPQMDFVFSVPSMSLEWLIASYVVHILTT